MIIDLEGGPKKKQTKRKLILVEAISHTLLSRKSLTAFNFSKTSDLMPITGDVSI